jgi:hypothetical protein
VGVGIETGPTRHVGHFWPIVPTPGDCVDGEFGGMKIGRGSWSTLSTTNHTWPDPGANPGRRGGKPVTNLAALSSLLTNPLSTSLWKLKRFQNYWAHRGRKWACWQVFRIGNKKALYVGIRNFIINILHKMLFPQSNYGKWGTRDIGEMRKCIQDNPERKTWHQRFRSRYKYNIKIDKLLWIRLLTFLLTYLRSWALLEEPLIGQPLKNFPAFHGTRKFNTLFTRALCWSLSWAISIQSTPSHPNSVHPPTSWSSQWSLSFWISHQYPIINLQVSYDFRNILTS